jgi:hypothetical protein
MWMRKRRESFVQDLYGTVADLAELEQRLMALSVELAQTGQKKASESTSRMVLTVQERGLLLRRHADRLTQTGNLGRRESDQASESSASLLNGATLQPSRF